MSAVKDYEAAPVAGPNTERSSASEVRAALLRATPMILGYLPVGFTFGVVSLGAGLSALNTLLLSLLVFAASSQLMAVQLLALNAPILTVVATVFVVNLRHLLMSSSLAPYLRRYRPWQLALFTFQLCDESFAVHSLEFSRRSPSRTETLVVNLALYLALAGGTAAALITRASPAHMQCLGLDYAPVAMFIALLVLLIKDRLQLLVAVFCGALAVALRLTALGTWSIVIATLGAATLGALGERWINKKSS